MSAERTPPPPDTAAQAMGDEAWVEVIRKMDEVYNDLLQYEVALEQKNADLEASQQFINSVLSSMSDILIVCDRDGRIEEVNASLCQFVGRAASELERQPVHQLFANPLEQARISQLLAQGVQPVLHDQAFLMQGSEGQAVPVSINCTPRLSATGKRVGTVITGRPVGELRRAYEALHQAHEDLKRTQSQLLHAEKMASLGRLVAGVAHELNNPISFVLGNVGALKKYAQRLDSYLGQVHQHAMAQDPDLLLQRQTLGIDRLMADLPGLVAGMIEGAERTHDIIDALKRFSAADRSATEVVVLRDIIERATRWVGQDTAARFQVTIDLPADLCVQGSSGQLQQVAMNLIQNARDATAGVASGRLHIHAPQVDHSTLNAPTIHLCFDDNGPGIPEAHLPRLFEPFFTTKPVGQGTGLGLSISYGLVERHGGHLAASNRPEGGARFTLSIPLYASAPLSVDTPSSPPLSQEHSPHGHPAR